MKKPENIELLLVEYAEGTLDPKYLAAVEAWLEAHPEDLELVKEWDEFKLAPDLTAKESSFDELYVDEEIEEDLFLEIEGQLEPKAQERLLKEVNASAPLKREHRLYQLTRLDYDRDKLIYPDKEKLKKKSTPVVSLFSRTWIQYAAAATFTGFMVWFYLSPEASIQYAFRDTDSYPKKLELKEVDLKIPSLPALATKDFIAETSSPNAKENELQKETPVNRESGLKPLQPIDRTIDLSKSQSRELLSYKAFQTLNPQKASPKTGSKLQFNNVYAFARHQILKRLSPGLEDKSNTDVLVESIERMSDGKMSIQVENGKLLALQTPLLDLKRSQQ